jgi:3-hydroxybutyryl-CoA dehydrogenase
MEIKKIGVVGAGAMGNGIAMTASMAGLDVIMRDIKDEFIDRGMKTINGFLSKSVDKGKMEAAQKDEILGRITPTLDMSLMKDADYVIEVVIEDLKLKKEVFKELDEICKPDVIIATNTSSMSITEIAAVTKRPDKICGMHFFNPVPIMRLVEVISGMLTSEETAATAIELAKKMGKTPVNVRKDTPGFIVNRIMLPHLLEAIKIVEEGIASIEDVDIAVKNGLNYPMGPFELMDMSGIDIAYFVTEYFFAEMNKELKWVSPTTLKNKIRANKLGRKTGGGWYDYSK